MSAEPGEIMALDARFAQQQSDGNWDAVEIAPRRGWDATKKLGEHGRRLGVQGQIAAMDSSAHIAKMSVYQGY